jgi:hypothetical protein
MSAIMSQASGSGAAASQQLPGLQLCDISDLILDSATEPKEGGNGNVNAPHTMLTVDNALISYFVAGVVLRAFLNGSRRETTQGQSHSQPSRLEEVHPGSRDHAQGE